MKPATITTDTGKVAVSMLAGWGLDWADTIAAIEDEARDSMGDRMVPALRNLVIRARMVAEWCDARRHTPRALNEELRYLGEALAAFDKASKQ